MYGMKKELRLKVLNGMTNGLQKLKLLKLKIIWIIRDCETHNFHISPSKCFKMLLWICCLLYFIWDFRGTLISMSKSTAASLLDSLSKVYLLNFFLSCSIHWLSGHAPYLRSTRVGVRIPVESVFFQCNSVHARYTKIKLSMNHC